jgi:hypothetical protein
VLQRETISFLCHDTDKTNANRTSSGSGTNRNSSNSHSVSSDGSLGASAQFEFVGFVRIVFLLLVLFPLSCLGLFVDCSAVLLVSMFHFHFIVSSFSAFARIQRGVANLALISLSATSHWGGV